MALPLCAITRWHTHVIPVPGDRGMENWELQLVSNYIHKHIENHHTHIHTGCNPSHHYHLCLYSSENMYVRNPCKNILWFTSRSGGNHVRWCTWATKEKFISRPASSFRALACSFQPWLLVLRGPALCVVSSPYSWFGSLLVSTSSSRKTDCPRPPLHCAQQTSNLNAVCIPCSDSEFLFIVSLDSCLWTLWNPDLPKETG